jgi:DNA repair exonuclease SbcCD nuclease subunit
MSKAIQYIYHLADIHVRNHERHDEYRKVFKTLYEKLRNEEKGLIVLAGDILHNKTSMSPEAIQLTTELLKNLSEISHVVLIPGNHDGNVNTTASMDCLTPIVNAIERDKLTYMKEGGVYEYRNMIIGVSSVFENNNVHALNEKQMKSKKKKIYLYHGPVYGCRNTAGYKLKSDVKTDHFNGYDLVLLGDIHQYQYLNESKTIAYSGSLIQQDFGESIDKHGYIKWNLVNNTSEFVEVENETAYLILNVQNNTLQSEFMHISPYVKNIRLRIDYLNSSMECLKAVEESISKRFNIVELTYKQIHEVSTIPQTQLIETKEINKMEIYTPIIKQYLTRPEYTIFTDQEKEFIQHSILTKIGQSKSTQPRWKLMHMKWFNMFCYDGIQQIQFDELGGIVGIVGNNAIGKSSLIDILLFALFHQTTKFALGQLKELQYLKNMLVSNTNNNTYYVELTFKLNNEMYMIRREVFKSKGSKTTTSTEYNYDVNLFKWSSVSNQPEVNNTTADEETITTTEPHWQKISAETKTKTNKLIEDMIGTFDDFINYFVMIQKNEHGFIEMSQEDRKKIINQASHLDGITELHDKAKTEYQEIKIKNKLLQQDIEKIDLVSLNTKRKELENDITTNNYTRERYIKELGEMEQEMSLFDVGNVTIVKPSIDIKTEMDELDTYISSLQHKLETSHEHITEVKHVLNDNKQTHLTLTEQLKTYEIEKQVLMKTVNADLEEIETKYTYDELKNKVQTLKTFFKTHTEEEINTFKHNQQHNQQINTKIEMLEQSIKNINLEYNPDCEICLKKNKQEIMKVKEMKTKIETLKESIKPVDAKLIEVYGINKKKLELYQQQIDFLDGQEAINKIRDLTSLIDKFTSDKRAIDKKITEQTRDIENTRTVVEKTTIEINKMNVKRDNLQKLYMETVTKEEIITNNKTLFERKDLLNAKIKELTKLTKILKE